MAKFVLDVWGRYINSDLIEMIDFAYVDQLPTIRATLNKTIKIPGQHSSDRPLNYVVLKQLEPDINADEARRQLKEFIESL